MSTVTANHTRHYPNTFTTFELSCQNGSHTQTLSIVASYINPQPDPTEKEEIEKWEHVISEGAIHSNVPLMVIGDLNKNGLKIMERISKKSPLFNQAAHLTTFDNGRYEASLDAIYVKNLMTK